MMTEHFIKSFIVLLIVVFSACGSNDKKDKADTKVVSGKLIGKDTLRVIVNSNDKMQFDVEEIRVKENHTIRLILHHTGSMPITSMGHNLVILGKDVPFTEFAKKAIEAHSNDYIPPSATSDIIAYTRLIGGDESDTITFSSPSVGTYDFLCSFPGHYSIMKGKFIVE